MANWTIITCFFELPSRPGAKKRDVDFYINNSKNTLSVNADLIIWTEERFVHKLKDIRYKQIGDKYQTKFIVTELFDLTLFKLHYDKCKILLQYKQHSKDSAEYILLQCATWDMVYRATIDNPFDSSYFAWLDIGFGYMNSFEQDDFNAILAAYQDKFSLSYIHYRTNSELETALLTKKWLCSAAGTFWTAGKNYMQKCILDFKNKFDYYLSRDMISNEDHYMAMTVNDHPEWIRLYTGDFKSVVANYNKLQMYTSSIYLFFETAYTHNRYDLITDVLANTYQDISLVLQVIRTGRLKGNNELCCYLGLQLIDNNNLDDKQLVALYQDISICCFYTKYKDLGLEYCDKVILSSYSNKQQKQEAITNLKWYVKPIHHVIKNDYTDHRPFGEDYLPSSTSFVIHNGEIWGNIRFVNYTIKDNGSYIIKDIQNRIITQNLLIRTDNKLNILDSYKLMDKSNIEKYSSKILGYEDIRLFNHNNKLYFLCTNLETNNKNIPQICLGTLDKNIITKITPLNITDENKLSCEKNWLPFVDYEDNVKLIYSWQPFRLFNLNLDTGECNEEINIILNENINIEEFRGSAAPLKFNNGYLSSIHYVEYKQPRIYYHRLVWLSKDFTEIKISKTFCFEQANIEFNLSLLVRNEDILLSYSYRDNSSKVISISSKELNTMFM